MSDRGRASLLLPIVGLAVVLSAVAAGVWLVLDGEGRRADDGASVSVVSPDAEGGSDPEASDAVGSARQRVDVDSDDEWSAIPDDDDGSLEAWIYRLCGPGLPESMRAEPRDVLRKWNPAQAVPELLDVCYRKEEGWRHEWAMIQVALFKDGAAPWAKEVASFIADEKLEWASLFALGAMGKAGVPFVVEATRAERGWTRTYAVEAMDETSFTCREYVEAAVPLLRDPDERVRASAYRYLGSTDLALDLTVPALVERLGDDRATVLLTIDALDGLDDGAEAAVPALIRLLDSGDPEIAIAAASALSEIPSAAAAAVPSMAPLIEVDPRAYWKIVPFIAALSLEESLAGLRADDPHVRGAYASGARSIYAHHPEHAEAIVTALAPLLEQGSQLRPIALLMLQKIPEGREPAVPALRRIAEAESVPAPDRRIVGELLAEILGASAEAASALAANLDSGSSHDRVRALQEIRDLGSVGAAVIEDVRPYASDESDMVRVAALEALEAMGPDAKEALPEIRAALASKNDLVRLAAALAVLAVDPPGNDVFDVLRSYRVHDLRGTMIRGLVRHPRPELVGVLVDRIDDRDRRIGDLAVEALQEIPRAAIPALKRRFESTVNGRARESVVYALTEIGVDARTALRELADRDDVSDQFARRMRDAARAMR